MLDWEERLFLGLKAIYRGIVVRPRDRRRAITRVALGECRQSLLLLAQMIAGRNLSIFETTDPALCRDDRVFLPPDSSVANSRAGNQALYETRAILAALAIRDGWGRDGTPIKEWATRYLAEFPGLAEKLAVLRREGPVDLDFWTSLAHPDPAASPKDPEAGGTTESEAGKDRVTTEIRGKGQADVEVEPATDGDGEGADLPMHTFEKVETLEEYTGQSRKSDADDELEEHEEALQDLDMTRLRRSSERPRSIYRSDVILEGLVFEVGDEAGGAGIPYPEWDHRRQAYRRDWCFVRERRVTREEPDWARLAEARHRRLLEQLRGQFAVLVSSWLRVRRQPVGADFDLDAVIDSEVERRTGHTPSEAVYLDRRRELHDISVLILMDQSYSTDSWLEDRRVLDVIRESVLCVGEVLDEYVEDFALATFASNTRRSCEFNLLKDFDDPWETSRGRLGSLEACGYTRIGPALRHAQERLMRRRSARKAIILLTDGRPCDYDRYEGTYGVKDVKKAIEVGRKNGILTHAFAVEKQAAEYFPRMFNHRDYDILPAPDDLARTMCRLFARLLAG